MEKLLCTLITMMKQAEAKNAASQLWYLCSCYNAAVKMRNCINTPKEGKADKWLLKAYGFAAAIPGEVKFELFRMIGKAWDEVKYGIVGA